MFRELFERFNRNRERNSDRIEVGCFASGICDGKCMKTRTGVHMNHTVSGTVEDLKGRVATIRDVNGAVHGYCRKLQKLSFLPASQTK